MIDLSQVCDQEAKNDLKNWWGGSGEIATLDFTQRKFILNSVFCLFYFVYKTIVVLDNKEFKIQNKENDLATYYLPQ